MNWLKGIIKYGIFLLFIGLCADTSAQITQKGVVIFKLKNDKIHVNNVVKKLYTDLSKIEINDIRQIFPENAVPSVGMGDKTMEEGNELHLIYRLNIRPDSMTQIAIEHLQSFDDILYAQPKYIPQIAGVTNDSLIERNINHLRLIDAFNSWENQRGDSTIKIGIIDTGSDLDHVDLNDNIFLNHADPINGIDDDGDGYTDNFWGWDVAENDNDPQSVKIHHGVHMCGIVGATINNSIGVAGIGNGCKFMVVKISDDTTGALIAAYEGMKYAADAGCQIISCSWGGYFVGDFEKEIVNYVVNQKNCLVVGSAGNDDRDDIFYPAAFEGVLAVGNVDTNDYKAFNSNFNDRIDVSAPGVSFTSTWNDNQYQSTSGTSVSSSIVAGAAGLIKSRFPELSNEDLILRIKNTSTYIDYKNQEYTGKLGTGRLQLFRALENKLTPNFREKTIIISPNPIVREHSNLNIQWYNEKVSSVVIMIYDMNGKEVYNRNFQNLSIGNYEYEIDVEIFSQGMYIVEFKMPGNDIIQKIVVQ